MGPTDLAIHPLRFTGAVALLGLLDFGLILTKPNSGQLSHHDAEPRESCHVM